MADQKKIEALKLLLARVEDADEAARQVVLATERVGSALSKLICDHAGEARQIMRESQKTLIVAIYDEEKRQ